MKDIGKISLQEESQPQESTANNTSARRLPPSGSGSGESAHILGYGTYSQSVPDQLIIDNFKWNVFTSFSWQAFTTNDLNTFDPVNCLFSVQLSALNIQYVGVVEGANVNSTIYAPVTTNILKPSLAAGGLTPIRLEFYYESLHAISQNFDALGVGDDPEDHYYPIKITVVLAFVFDSETKQLVLDVVETTTEDIG